MLTALCRMPLTVLYVPCVLMFKVLLAGQDEFDQIRAAELAEAQRMEETERRRAEEKERRLAQVCL